MEQELKGKVALVTGSGRGLGSVMARKLAEMGADVVVHDLSWDAPAKYGEAADLGVTVARRNRSRLSGCDQEQGRGGRTGDANDRPCSGSSTAGSKKHRSG